MSQLLVRGYYRELSSAKDSTTKRCNSATDWFSKSGHIEKFGDVIVHGFVLFNLL